MTPTTAPGSVSTTDTPHFPRNSSEDVVLPLDIRLETFLEEATEVAPVQSYDALSPTQENPVAHVASNATPRTDAVKEKVESVMNDQGISR